MDLAEELGRLASDVLGRAMLLEAKLGMRVRGMPPAGHFASKLVRCEICMVTTLDWLTGREQFDAGEH
jgi:hypothetical protein